MSKNDHMLSLRSVIVGAERPTRGPASLAQGVYGARGNLELVACDAQDGLWVFWFNADWPSDPPAAPDVPPGTWSAGLHFAAGRSYTDAVILQSTLGPDHLEVLALGQDGVLESWYWSPGPGFQRRAGDVASSVSDFVAEHDSGTVWVSVEHGDGSVEHAVSDAAGYPDRIWRRSAGGPLLGTDLGARTLLRAAGVPADDVAVGTARQHRSTRNGGTIELTWRDAAGALRHLGIPAERTPRLRP